MAIVLVTGASGFIGSHCILQLLAGGHDVRGTVRSLDREGAVRSMLKAGGIDAGNRLRLVAADLERDAGWSEAVAGCHYVLHVASPFPPVAPAHEDELIVPAREGALRVLRAARGAGVTRVVLTSSFAAIGYGHPPQPAPFDETSWTNLDGADVQPYMKSKTVAERAAWDFVAAEGSGLEMAVVNPAGVFGPVLGPDLSTSIGLVRQLIEGALPACPRLYFSPVDVRDVADLHLRAMTHPAAAGQRFIAVAGPCLSIVEMARLLRRRMGPAARRVPRWQAPDWVVRLAARRNPQLRSILPQLGRIRRSTGEKAKRLLGWAPRPGEDGLVATAESLIKLGLVEAP
jgi:nucleoside-diphosphate-sugar epimerase